MNLTERIAQAQREIAQAAQDAARSLQNLPDNPSIDRKGPRAFVMSSANVGQNWSAFFHDWPAQHRKISEMLEKQQFSEIRHVLQNGKSSAKDHYAPEVIERIKKIVGDLVLEHQEESELRSSTRMRP